MYFSYNENLNLEISGGEVFTITSSSGIKAIFEANKTLEYFEHEGYNYVPKSGSYSLDLDTITIANIVSKYSHDYVNDAHVVFVEVKSRKNSEENFSKYGLPCEAVNREKQKHIVYTARHYLNLFPTKKEMRFDVIEVYLGDKIEINHIENAFLT